MIKGYIRTIRNYMRTAKGKHDVKEYMKAIIVIMVTTMIIVVMIR